MFQAIKENPSGLAWCLMLTFAVMILPDLAVAGSTTESSSAGGSTISNVLCDVVDWFTGPVGKGIATLAIIIVGIGALMGKVSWGMAIIVGIGVAVIFGASTLVDDLGGSSGSCS